MTPSSLNTRDSVAHGPQQTRRLVGDKERALQRRFVLVASLFLMIVFGVAIAVLLSAAQRANDVEERAGVRIMTSLIKNNIDELRGRALESAFWDDFVDQVETGLDPVWVDDNIGEFLHEATDLSLTLIIGPQNTPLLNVIEGERRQLEPLENITPTFETRLQTLRQGPTDPPDVSAGILFLSGVVYVIGMAPITPEYPATGYSREERSILVLGRAFTTDRLLKIAEDFGLEDLRFTREQPDTAAVEQFDMTGQQLGWFTWTPRKPGRAWLRVILPGLAIAFLAVLILGALLVRLWRSALNRMRTQERDLTVAVEQAVNASRAKTVFLASMSHELRTPLNAVIGFSNILKAEMFGPVGSPKYLEYVQDIYATSSHLLKLIDSILDWATLEAEPPALEEDVCSIAGLFADAFTLAETKSTHITVSSDISPQALAVRGDRTKLVQIITNLLTNAIKASQAGQDINLTARQDNEGRLIISVSDQGIGISNDAMERLFQPFQRSSDAYRSDASGAGLGLVISLRLAELHQGHVDLQRGMSGGTIATLTLPPERAVIIDES